MLDLTPDLFTAPWASRASCQEQVLGFCATEVPGTYLSRSLPVLALLLEQGEFDPISDHDRYCHLFIPGSAFGFWDINSARAWPISVGLNARRQADHGPFDGIAEGIATPSSIDN